MLASINHEQGLYVRHAENGFTCLGFNVALELSTGVAKWLKQHGEQSEMPNPELCGTTEGFHEYRCLMDSGLISIVERASGVISNSLRNSWGLRDDESKSWIETDRNVDSGWAKAPVGCPFIWRSHGPTALMGIAHTEHRSSQCEYGKVS